MAPKGAGSKRPRPAANAKFSRTVDSGCCSADTDRHLDEIHDKTLQKRCRTQQNRRDIEQKVDRNMKLRFSHLPLHIQMHRRVDGKTLREHIFQAMTDGNSTGRLGATWWAELAAKFAAGTDPCADLSAADPQQPVDTKLVECLDKMVDENPCARSEEPIISYFTNSNEALNNREAVGVLKTLSSLKLGCCKRYDGVVVAFLNHIKKTGSQASMTLTDSCFCCHQED